MELKYDNIANFLEFMDKTPTPFLTLAELSEALKAAGGTETTLSEVNHAESGRLYFTNFGDNCLAAFYAGKNAKSFRIGAAHTDYPVLKVKSAGLRKGGQALRINVEAYGGLIHHSWLDRALKLCGRVYYLAAEEISFLDFADLGPRFVIPDAAIHMNRGINDGAKYSVQNQLLPIFGLDTEDGEIKLSELLADKISQASGIAVAKEDLLSFDLSLVTAENAELCGASREFISAQGLDDRSMIHAIFSGLIGNVQDGCCGDQTISVAFAFNHEECGSQSSGGARSVFAAELIKALSWHFIPGHYLDSCAKSYLFSADMGHALHPSYPELSDGSSPVYLGGGVTLKSSWNQSYATDAGASAFFAKLCEDGKVPYQRFSNNADVRGGGTIGPMLASQLGIAVCDLGIAMLSMHASREFEAVSDQLATAKLFRAFFG